MLESLGFKNELQIARDERKAKERESLRAFLARKKEEEKQMELELWGK